MLGLLDFEIDKRKDYLAAPGVFYILSNSSEADDTSQGSGDSNNRGKNNEKLILNEMGPC